MPASVHVPVPVKVCANRTFNVLPIVEGVYDMGNLAAVCRSADGELRCIAVGWRC